MHWTLVPEHPSVLRVEDVKREGEGELDVMRNPPALSITDTDIADLAPPPDICGVERRGLPNGPSQRQSGFGDPPLLAHDRFAVVESYLVGRAAEGRAEDGGDPVAKCPAGNEFVHVYGEVLEIRVGPGHLEPVHLRQRHGHYQKERDRCHCQGGQEPAAEGQGQKMAGGLHGHGDILPINSFIGTGPLCPSAFAPLRTS